MALVLTEEQEMLRDGHVVTRVDINYVEARILGPQRCVSVPAAQVAYVFFVHCAAGEYVGVGSKARIVAASSQ